jgi:hypothetical protein
MLACKHSCTAYVVPSQRAFKTKGIMCCRSRREVAQELKVNLCVYDYSGYGCSTGTPSVANTVADIDACYSWLLSRGFVPSEIVLYGQSIGSGPSVNLAARTPKIGGLILHAAFSGGDYLTSSSYKGVAPLRLEGRHTCDKSDPSLKKTSSFFIYVDVCDAIKSCFYAGKKMMGRGNLLQRIM